MIGFGVAGGFSPCGGTSELFARQIFSPTELQRVPEWFDQLRFEQLRRLERSVSVDSLYRVIYCGTGVRARWKAFFNPPPVRQVPPIFSRPWDRKKALQQFVGGRINQYVRVFQDRLHEPRWRERCQMEGLPVVQSAQASGRPVVLAFCHFGPISLFRPWLWANGIRAVILRAATREKESAFNLQLEQFQASQEAATVIHRQNLRAATRALDSGQPLLIAIDPLVGKQFQVPFMPGWQFQMATGPLRLAASRNAILIPCSILDLGRWRFRLRFGKPVPSEVLDERSFVAAGSHLLSELFSVMKDHPEQCRNAIFRNLRKETAARHEGFTSAALEETIDENE